MILNPVKENPKPLISVLMCTYNGAEYVREQLDSIIRQSLKDFELIVLDDKSVDKTYDILLEYAMQYDFIRVIQNPVNLGFNKNFEKGMLLAKGDFIACSDQDDIWLPDKLAKLYAAIGTKSVVFSNSVYINEMGHKIKFIDERGIERDHCLLRDFSLNTDYRGLLLGNFVTGHTMLLRRDFLSYILPVPQHGYYDWWIGFVALYQKKLCYLDEVLTQYRKHPDSVINKNLRTDPLHLVIYKSSRHHFAHFYHDITGLDDFKLVKLLKAIYGPPLSKLHYAFIFVLLYFNYNKLFPLMRRRKPISKTRFRMVRKYMDETEMAKQYFIKTKKQTNYGIDYYCFN